MIKIIAGFILPGLFVCAMPFSHAEGASLNGLQTMDINDATSIPLGSAFDLLDGNFTSGNPLGRQVVPEMYTTVNVGAVKYDIEVLDSIQSLSSKISGSGDASYGGYGRADASFVRNSGYNSFSSYGILRVRYIARVDTLKDEAKQFSSLALSRLTNTNNPDFFTQAFGDSCVVQKYRGGILTIWFKTQAQSRDTFATNRMHLHAGFGCFGVNANYATAKQELSQVTGLEIHGYQLGAGVTNDGKFVATNLDQLVSMLQEFPAKVENAMQSDPNWDNTIRVGFGPYIVFTNYPDAQQTVLRDVEGAFLTLKEIEKKKIACEIALSDFVFSDTHADYYENYSLAASRQNQRTLDGRILWLGRAELAVRQNTPLDSHALELIDPVQGTIDVFSGYRILPVPLRFDTTRMTSFMKFVGGGDDDVHTKDGRKTKVILTSHCGQEDNKKPYIDFTMVVTEMGKNNTQFRGTNRVYPAVPPNMLNFKVIDAGSNVELQYVDTYKTERNGFFDANAYLPKQKTIVDSMSLCIDSASDHDGPFLGFQVRGWATFLMMPNP